MVLKLFWENYKMDFNKLYKKGIIRLIKPNDNLAEAYVKNSDEYIKSANLLMEHQFLSRAVIDFYYAMYYALSALLFKCGIKSEDHNASIEIFKIFIDKNIIKKDLYKKILDAKDERINQQYYLKPINLKSVKKISSDAISFINSIKELIYNLDDEVIKSVLESFKSLLK